MRDDVRARRGVVIKCPLQPRVAYVNRQECHERNYRRSFARVSGICVAFLRVFPPIRRRAPIQSVLAPRQTTCAPAATGTAVAMGIGVTFEPLQNVVSL